jgi:hypothetical protein
MFLENTTTKEGVVSLIGRLDDDFGDLGSIPCDLA